MGGNGAYITAEDIAAEQGVSVHTVRGYFRREHDPLPGRKVGRGWRTTRTAYDSWLAGHGDIPRRRREDQAAEIIMLSSIEIEALTDVEPPTFLLHLGGVVSGSDRQFTTMFAASGDGLAALTASCMQQAPLAPDFTESLMARLEAAQGPHRHEPEPEPVG